MVCCIAVLSDFEAQLRYFSRRSGRRFRAHPRSSEARDRRSFFFHFLVPIAIHRARRSSWCSHDQKKVGLMLPPWIADIVLARSLRLRKACRDDEIACCFTTRLSRDQRGDTSRESPRILRSRA